MGDPRLLEFGEFLMRKVRDQSIGVFTDRLDGKALGKSASYYANILQQGGSAGRDTVRKFLPDIVDLVLHYLLWSIEESERVHIVVKDQDECPESLKLFSDGFPGELYTEMGWIARLARERRGEY